MLYELCIHPVTTVYARTITKNLYLVFRDAPLDIKGEGSRPKLGSAFGQVSFFFFFFKFLWLCGSDFFLYEHVDKDYFYSGHGGV